VAWAEWADSVFGVKSFTSTRFLGHPHVIINGGAFEKALPKCRETRIPDAETCAPNFRAPLRDVISVHVYAGKPEEVELGLREAEVNIFNADPHVFWSMDERGYVGTRCWEDDESLVSAANAQV
jgi:hypothetical protein